MVRVKNRLLRFSANLLLVGCALLVPLLMLEIFFRWIVPDRYVYQFGRFLVESVDQRDREDLIDDPNLGPGLTISEGQRAYRLRRNMVARFDSSEYHSRLTTNDFGLRGKSPRSDSAVRILNLGDSFCMGYGVNDDETYSEKLESLFRQAGHGEVEVINAGVLGYNALSSYFYLVEEGQTLKPDFVVLELWAADDVFENQQIPKLKLTKDAGLYDKLRKTALRSQTAMFLVDRMRSLPAVRRWMLDRGLLERYGIDLMLRRDAPERFKDHLEELDRTIGKIKAYCDEHQIGFFLLLIPAREQVLTGSLENAVAYNLRPEPFQDEDLDIPSRVIRNLAAKNQVFLIDLLESFRQNCGAQACYFPKQDPHITSFGHKFIADTLFRNLEPEVAFRMRKKSLRVSFSTRNNPPPASLRPLNAERPGLLRGPAFLENPLAHS